MQTNKKLLSLLAACLLLLTSCAAPPEPEGEEEPEGALIYAALNPVTNHLNKNIEMYNKFHSDTPIVVHDYSDEGGPERLMTELVLGQVPDILEMQCLGYYRAPIITDPGVIARNSPYDKNFTEALWYDSPFDADLSQMFWLPYRQMVNQGYLEDLWPYIDSDPEFGRERILEAPLKAAEVDGGLYMLPKYVSVSTLAGPRSIVGDRCGWTLAELMEAYAAMPEGSTILRYDTTRWQVFSRLLAPLLDQFIDWETGECNFDSQGFRDMLDFLELFPDSVDTWLTSTQLEEENFWRKQDGLQMLEPLSVSRVQTLASYDARFGEAVSCIGYPTVDGSSGSSFIFHGPTLAMSTTCRDKEAAWAFICRMLRADSKSVSWMMEANGSSWIRIPLNWIAYKLSVMADLQGTGAYYLQSYSGGPLLEAPSPTEEDAHRFHELVTSTAQLYWPDSQLSESVWDAIAPYFSGDKPLEETIDMVNRRVKLYVNENR